MKTLFEALNTTGIYICAFLMAVMVVNNFANKARFNSMDSTIKTCIDNSKKARDGVIMIDKALHFEPEPGEIQNAHWQTYEIRRNVYWNDKVYKERKRLSKLPKIPADVLFLGEG